jgi:organic radical activating enzyme
MSLKYFPIKQGVACPQKWTWNTLRLYDGTTSSCHRVKPVELDLDNFKNFHNYQTWLDHRNLMLSGKFPKAGCEYCEKIETAGGISDRLTHSKSLYLSPPELEIDPTSIYVTPRVLEVFLDNVCNLSCIYCDESNSSRIEQENKKFGYLKNNTTHLISEINKSQNFDLLTDKFFEYLNENYHHLRRLHILGGEPFYQKSFDRLMDFIANNKNPELELNIVTNLTPTTAKLEKFVKLSRQLLIDNKIKRIDITASLDCLGKEQEYVRNGLNLELWKTNFDLLAKHKWITLNINSTISALTIGTMPDLIKYINVIKSFRKVHHTFGYVDGRQHLNCDIFGPDFFKDTFTNILQLMPMSTDWEIAQKEYMTGLSHRYANSTVDTENLNNLQVYLDELDRRRNQNWRLIFPCINKYLTEILSNVVQ